MLSSLAGRARGGRKSDELVRKFLASHGGIAATEFAILAPVMIAILLGGFETLRAVAASTRSTYLANTLAELLSQSTLILTTSDLNKIIETAPVINPDLLRYAQLNGRSDVWNIADVSVSSVQFSPTVAGCTSNCVYRGDLVFSYALNGTTRPCGEVTTNTSPKPGTSMLPFEVFGPGSVIVVDIKVPYQPLVSTVLGTDFSFERTAYLRPRYIDRVNYTTNCKGF